MQDINIQNGEKAEILIKEDTTQFGVQFLMEDGSIMSHANTDDWDNTTRLQRLIGFFWKGYKNRFIKPEPFKAEFTDDQCAECGATMTMGYCNSGCDDYLDEDNNYVL